MLRAVVIALVVLLSGPFAWVVFQASDITIVVNGQKLAGPAKMVEQAGNKTVIALPSAFCLLPSAF